MTVADATNVRSSLDWFTVRLHGGDDHYESLAAKRIKVGVEQVLPFGGAASVVGTYAVYRRRDVVAILRDPDRFTLDIVRDRYRAVLGRRALVNIEPDAHRPLRALTARALSDQLEGLTALVSDVVDELLDHLAPEAVYDLVPRFTSLVPVHVLLRVLGLPRSLGPSVAEWTAAMAGFADRPRDGIRAARALRRVLVEALRDREVMPTDDLLGSLAAAIRRGSVDEPDVVATLMLLMWAGTETTFPALSSLLFALLTHPGQLEAVRRDRSLVSAAIDEVLRWEAPVQLTCRTVAADVQVGDRIVPAGSIVLPHIGSANRDVPVEERPERFDITRPNKEHFAFGAGVHRCLGLHLAGLVLRGAVCGLLDRYDDISFAAELPRMTGSLVRSPTHLRVRLSQP